MNDRTRPVQLQINNSGAWKTVAKFDAGDERAGDDAQKAVELLGQVDSGNKAVWRIATDEALPCVLLRWSLATGWMEES